ncbi:MAG: fumarylacetoacetate hydrolase family protein [Kiloniellales bacterium]|nr:fumarylacetoacetate hydrolase family protein [Kiloniellales bacterium]
MKLASLRGESRDGQLLVVSRDLARAVPAREIAPTLQAALDDWAAVAPRLESLSERLNRGSLPGEMAFDPAALAAPLPRAYHFVDGSAYLSHMELLRQARGAELPDSFRHDPLVYQAGSDANLGPRDPIPLADEAWGLDFEAEIGVVTDDVALGASPATAGGRIRLLLLLNDVSLRHLIPGELAKGFGFYQGKPASAFSPVALTPDELGPAWDGRKVHLPLRVEVNGELFGAPEAGEDMAFDFPQLIAHAAKTRRLAAGTIVGSGTVSNRDRSRGSCCIAERRMLEKIESGAAQTPFLKVGDRVRIEMLDRDGGSLFGAIEQVVEAA